MKGKILIIVTFFLALFVSSCGKYNAIHYGCDCEPVNERFDGGYIFMPNIFSPSSDGVNDWLVIRSKGAYNISLKVKNHTGATVYYETNIENQSNYGWNGQSMKNGKTCKTDNYKYELKYTTPDGQEHEISRKVTLLHSRQLSDKDYLDANCIKDYKNCVFGSQWISDTATLSPVELSNDLISGSCN